MSVRSGTREGRRMNPHVVPPSQHTLFMRGFHPNTEMNKIRDFFTKEGGKCSFDFFKVSQDGTRLFVALRFESKDVAKEILSRYDNASVIGSKITITWFKDLRRARLKAMQHGQRWNNFYGHMKNGYGRGGGYMHNKFGSRMKSTVWRQQGKFHDEHRRSSSSSRSYSRSRSRSRSKSRSRSRSRSWTRSRSHERSVSPRHYRSRSSSSSRASGSDRLKKRSWKHDTSQKNEQYGPEVAEKSEEAPVKDPILVDELEAKQDENWQSKKTEAPETQGPRSPASSQERAASRSDSHSRSTSASSHSHGKDRKKKKKKHHRSKHRRHRRRHRHQRDSSDEEGQLSDYEEGERSPTPDHHRRYRKRRRQSSSSSQESQTNKNKRGESDKGSTVQSNNLGFNLPLTESNQMQQDSLAAANAPVESGGHLTLRTLDAPSQVSDGMSPLHVSEGDEEETPTYNFRGPGVDRYGVNPTGSNHQVSDTNDTQLSKFSMQEELDNEDKLLTATRDALLREVHELTASATSGIAPKTISRPKTPSGVKSLLDKFKSTLKPAGTPVAEIEMPKSSPSPSPSPVKPSPAKPLTTAVNLPHLTRSDGGESRATDLAPHVASQAKSPSAHYAIRTTQNEETPRIDDNDYYDPEETSIMDDSADMSHEGASGDGPCMDKDFKSTVSGARRAIRTGGLNPDSTPVSLPKDKISLIKRKRAEIEAAYRQDCETFATVVKMLIRKDSKLEEYIQDSLRQNLYDIGQLCIEELKQFVEVVVSTDKL